jgi:UDP-N-acetyl-D-mannosaminuronic acid dehydrogenase
MATDTATGTEPALLAASAATTPAGARPSALLARTEARNVCVVGLGYIGLPTASLLASRGFSVAGVDTSASVVATINQGRIHIVEPDLESLVQSAVHGARLRASTTPQPADVFVIAVPTPIRADKRPDLSMVEAAARAIAPVVRAGNLVILESTSPVGTTEGVVARVLAEAGHKPGEDVYVAYCPERVLPGRILTELVENDRVVGGINPASTERAVEFYQAFVRGEVLATDARTAEMVKLTENSFRDVNIAFANELSMLCAREGVSVWELIRLANRHPRVKILNPGPGVGGHCIAVDPWFLVDRAPELARLIRTAREVNDAKPHWVVQRVQQCAAKLRDPVIACLGLSFKADVDDLRESPAVEIVHALQRLRVGRLLVVEPHVKSHPDFPIVALETALAEADIVLVLVDHKRFRRVPREALQEKILIDTRGVYL